MHPAVGQARGGRIGLVPVFREVHHAPDHEFAGFQRGAVAAVFGDRLDLDDGRHGATATARAVEERLAADGRGKALGLGHAPARARRALGDGLVDLPGVLGRHRRTAAARAPQARQVVLVAIRRLHELPGHRRHAVEIGDAFRPDDAQRLFGVPLVHADELAAAAEAGEGLHDEAGHMEQRHGEDRGRRIRRRRSGDRDFRIHRHGDGAAAFPAEQGIGDGPMRRQHAFGMRRRAGRVENRGAVFGRDFRRRHVGRRPVDEVLPSGESDLRVADGDDFDIKPVEVRLKALGPLPVREQQLQAAVLDPVDELLAGPPGVDGHRNRADGGHSHERGDPLRVVAQGDADAIAGLDAAFDQAVGALRRPFPHGAIGVALPLVDVEVLVGVVETALVERAQVRRRIREHGEVDAANAHRAGLIRLPGCRDRRHGGLEFRLHLPPLGAP